MTRHYKLKKIGLTPNVVQVYNIYINVRLTQLEGNVEMNLYDKIIETYKKTGSIIKTAELLGSNTIKVRRVLITEGLWSSSTSQSIGELYQQGLSTEQIAKKLVMSAKNVQSYLPYTKGVYGMGEKSDDSVRSKEYRDRKQKAAENQVGSNANSPKEIKTETPLVIKKEEIKVNNSHYGQKPVAMKLHLELKMPDIKPEEMNILRWHANVKKGISRDIIIPVDMTLHSLHYAIQRMFGWQNSHLHHFSFTEEVFNDLTQNSLKRWCSLCGIYFRFPDEELDDLYWDEDYDQSISFKNWLKWKYSPIFKDGQRIGYIYGGLGDYYYENQMKVKSLKEQIPVFEVRPSFEEFVNNKGKSNKKKKVVGIENATLFDFRNSIDLGFGLDHLLERLTVFDYLHLPDGNDYFREDLNEKIDFLEDSIDLSIRMWQLALRHIEEDDAEQFALLAQLSTTRMLGQSDRLIYSYDYGDGWEVEITCTDVYYKDYKSTKDGESVEMVLKVGPPICVETDGLSVLDDVGGVYGFIDFLRIIHQKTDIEKAEEYRAWAKSLGWTGRKQNSKTIL